MMGRILMHYSYTFIALLAAAVVLVPLFRFLKLGGVLGYLMAGVLIGPYVLGIVKDAHTLLEIAELGVTLLMFLVGLELQPARLYALRREVFGLGAGQVLACSTVGALGAWALGLPLPSLWIVGAAFAMSSTAFILPMLTDANAGQSRYGRESIAVCIFQDLAVIPILLAINLLGTSSGKVPGWPAFIVLVCLAFFGRRLLGWVFAYAARFGNNEVFTAAALCVTVTISAGLDTLGLSASLGAFIAGVLLADSAFKHKLEASIAPFEGLLLGMFFMAVGMGVNLTLLINQPALPLAIACGIIFGKALLIYALRRLLAPLLGQSACDSATALRLGFTLAVGGEFAFVLFQAAQSSGFLSQANVDTLTLGVVLSMALAPLSVLGLNKLMRHASTAPKRDYDTPERSNPTVVIAGFGRVGQIVGRLLNAKNIPFIALDASADHVDTVRQFGNKIYYGDAQELGLLESAQMQHARLFVLAVDDVDTSIHIANLVLQHYPSVKIIARARNRPHYLRLRALGIEFVMRETWLSSVELAKAALVALDAQGVDFEQFIARFIEHDEAMLAKQAAVADGDMAGLIEVSKQSRAELESILLADQEAKLQTSSS